MENQLDASIKERYTNFTVAGNAKISRVKVSKLKAVKRKLDNTFDESQKTSKAELDRAGEYLNSSIETAKTRLDREL